MPSAGSRTWEGRIERGNCAPLLLAVVAANNGRGSGVDVATVDGARPSTQGNQHERHALCLTLQSNTADVPLPPPPPLALSCQSGRRPPRHIWRCLATVNDASLLPPASPSHSG
eukprot:362200-Chlamydomonas_euryale.AAC.10